jgi:hypothetical protein
MSSPADVVVQLNTDNEAILAAQAESFALDNEMKRARIERNRRSIQPGQRQRGGRRTIQASGGYSDAYKTGASRPAGGGSAPMGSPIQPTLAATGGGRPTMGPSGIDAWRALNPGGPKQTTEPRSRVLGPTGRVITDRKEQEAASLAMAQSDPQYREDRAKEIARTASKVDLGSNRRTVAVNPLHAGPGQRTPRVPRTQQRAVNPVVNPLYVKV